MSNILFILKRNDELSIVDSYSKDMSSGLYNSAKYICDMFGNSSKITQVISSISIVNDNNDIDREVSKNKPDIVVVEALWVVPEKIKILSNMYPDTKWIIRLHSKIPFLASEGIAMGWTADYLKINLGKTIPNVYVAVNDYSTKTHLDSIFPSLMTHSYDDKILYLPNYFTLNPDAKYNYTGDGKTINIGCFGAIRPLKNHLNQAVAAIKFAYSNNLDLRFHINSTRVDSKSNNILKNLEGLFSNINGELVKHIWMDKSEFLDTCSTMDIGMQVSNSETFNIVSADYINSGIPIVVSNEIPWASFLSIADPSDINTMVSRLNIANNYGKLNHWHNKRKLTSYLKKTENAWDNVIHRIIRSV